MARGDQSFLPLGGSGRSTSPAGRLPMRAEPPPPADPDAPYRRLYAVLAYAMGACTSPEILVEWARDHRHAFDELAAGSPDRVARLRQIYSLHLANLRPAPVAPAALNRPPPVPDGQEEGDGETP